MTVGRDTAALRASVEASLRLADEKINQEIRQRAELALEVDTPSPGNTPRLAANTPLAATLRPCLVLFTTLPQSAPPSERYSLRSCGSNPHLHRVPAAPAGSHGRPGGGCRVRRRS